MHMHILSSQLRRPRRLHVCSVYKIDLGGNVTAHVPSRRQPNRIVHFVGGAFAGERIFAVFFVDKERAM